MGRGSHPVRLDSVEQGQVSERTSDAWVPLLPVLAVIGLPVLVVSAVWWAMPPSQVPVFSHGAMVRSKIGGHVGQVFNVKCNEDMCFYDVRFNAPQALTDTRVFSNDGPVTLGPVAEVRYMREFELEAAR